MVKATGRFQLRMLQRSDDLGDRVARRHDPPPDHPADVLLRDQPISHEGFATSSIRCRCSSTYLSQIAISGRNIRLRSPPV
jgi:hypothetical protein